MYTDKIFRDKLTKYLKELLKVYNNNPFSEFRKFAVDSVTQPKDPQEILKFYYFDKYFDFLYETKRVLDKKKMEPELIKELNSIVTREYARNTIDRSHNLNYYQFLMRYGRSDKNNILNSIFNEYYQSNKVDNQSLILSTSKIFLINSFTDKNWQSICREKLKIKNLPLNDGIIDKLVKHVYSADNVDSKETMSEEVAELQIASDLEKRDDITTTKTQMKIKKFLDILGVKYIEEFRHKQYTYDYFLPDLNAILEFHGPDHFYPLQTQLDEKNKFRMINIRENFSGKIIVIPFFEFMRFDTDQTTLSYLRNVIFKNYDLFEENSLLFKENFDLFGQIRKYKI